MIFEVIENYAQCEARNRRPEKKLLNYYLILEHFIQKQQGKTQVACIFQISVLEQVFTEE